MNLPDPLDASGNVSHYNISLFLFVLMLPMLFKTTEFIAVDNAEKRTQHLTTMRLYKKFLVVSPQRTTPIRKMKIRMQASKNFPLTKVKMHLKVTDISRTTRKHRI